VANGCRPTVLGVAVSGEVVTRLGIVRARLLRARTNEQPDQGHEALHAPTRPLRSTSRARSARKQHHASRRDTNAPLYRKDKPGGQALPLGHALTENQSSLPANKLSAAAQLTRLLRIRLRIHCGRRQKPPKQHPEYNYRSTAQDKSQEKISPRNKHTAISGFLRCIICMLLKQPSVVHYYSYRNHLPWRMLLFRKFGQWR
jgi:hypothetical protein